MADNAVQGVSEPRPPSGLQSLRPLVGQRWPFLAILAVAATAVLIRLMQPIGLGLFLGTLLAFALQPVFDRLLARHWRAKLAALLCTVAAVLLLAAVVIGVGYLIISELFVFLRGVPEALGPGGSLQGTLARLTEFLRAHRVNTDEQLTKLPERLAPVAQSLAAGVAGLSGALPLFFLMLALSCYTVLLRWRALVGTAERALPLDPEHTRTLFREFRLVGRQVLIGTVAGSLIQGTVGGLVCWVTGVPKPAFFGALTAVLSPIPVLGSLAVWASVGVFRIATGHLGAGIAELVLGAVFVGLLIDDVVRPLLVGGGEKFPVLFTFVGLLGGVGVFGLSGLLVGPIVVALCLAVLNLYIREQEGSPASVAVPRAIAPAAPRDDPTGS